MGGYAKSKRNPTGLCTCCKEKIFNRVKGAAYCKECFFNRQRIQSAIFNMVKRYSKLSNKNYKITVKIKVTKKTKELV